jgi:hypothetical protein
MPASMAARAAATVGKAAGEKSRLAWRLLSDTLFPIITNAAINARPGE